MYMYQHIKTPVEGEKVCVNEDFSLSVPDCPIIPYIEGDGIGVDITPVMQKVVNSAVAFFNLLMSALGRLRPLDTVSAHRPLSGA